jgi:hypothetical protein
MTSPNVVGCFTANSRELYNVIYFSLLIIDFSLQLAEVLFCTLRNSEALPKHEHENDDNNLRF